MAQPPPLEKIGPYAYGWNISTSHITSKPSTFKVI